MRQTNIILRLFTARAYALLFLILGLAFSPYPAQSTETVYIDSVNEIIIKKEEAIASATRAAGGFFGTWIKARLVNRNWHITSTSKSLVAPKYYVIDGLSGDVLLKLDNTDDPKQKQKLQKFLDSC